MKSRLSLTAWRRLISCGREDSNLSIIMCKPTDDIFLSGADALVNPVNCVGVMGAGLAAVYKKRYPSMFKEYKEVCSLGKLQLGKLHIYKVDEFLTIVNFPTKVDYREDSVLGSVETGMEALQQWTETAKKRVKSIAIPALGCGLGGLEWSVVEPVILKYAETLPCDVLIHPPR